MTKCPKCDNLINSVSIEDVDGKVLGRSAWRCISLNCPICSTSLGVQIDPIALKTDIVNEIKRGR